MIDDLDSQIKENNKILNGPPRIFCGISETMIDVDICTKIQESRPHMCKICLYGDCE
jgi:hypothetical protein